MIVFVLEKSDPSNELHNIHNADIFYLVGDKLQYVNDLVNMDFQTKYLIPDKSFLHIVNIFCLSLVKN